MAISPESGFWYSLGGAHYRVGDWKYALIALDKANELLNDGVDHQCITWFFLVMTHSQLGDKEKAHKYFDRAVQTLEASKRTDARLPRLRTEAAQRLGIQTLPKGKDK